MAIKHPDRLTRGGRLYVVIAAVVGVAMVGSGLAIWSHYRAERQLVASLRYDPSGYGGYHVAAPEASTAAPSGTQAAVRPSTTPATRPRPIQQVVQAYAAGRYKDVDAIAKQVVKAAAVSPRPVDRQDAVRAELLQAYSAARQHDFKAAAAFFTIAQTAAAKLPGGGVQPPMPNRQPQPTLQEDAAYEHAVCTQASGNRAAAEGEYVAFMRGFADSPLVHAALWRVQGMHNGTAPKVAEATWRHAEQVAMADQKHQQLEASMCGPECLAELLRRRGERATVPQLAREMGTTDEGTSLAQMASTAQKHGFVPQGLALTEKGLTAQQLPVIALTEPGHYVIVDAVAPSGVTIWDPDGMGEGHGTSRVVPAATWSTMWNGLTLTVGKIQSVRMARN